MKTRHEIFIVALVFAVFLFPLVLKAQNGDTASIAIDTHRVLGEVNRRVLGSNFIGYQFGTYKYAVTEYSNQGAGIWDPQKGRPVPEMVALARNAGITVARFPGGSAVHRYNWKKAIGDPNSRPNQQFGVPEFLQFCNAIGAIPVITLSEYVGSVQDAVDLVEYLNMPAIDSNPWALKRAHDGHKDPWKCVLFEFGNESYYGDGLSKKFSPEEYANRYIQYRNAMKAKDASIQLGLVGPSGFPELSDWLVPVLTVVKGQLDYVIHHCYIPSYQSNDEKVDVEKLFSVALSCTNQIARYYQEINSVVASMSQNKGVPIAVTEFNGLFLQDKPIPLRHTLGNALLNAEFIRLFMLPSSHISFANNWHFVNEYWGTLKGYVSRNDSIVKRPLYYVYQLYHNHFGDQLLSYDLKCSAYNSEGGYGILPSKDRGEDARLLDSSIQVSNRWILSEGVGFHQSQHDDTLVVEFSGDSDVNYFHARKLFSAEPNAWYRATIDIKTKDISSANGICLQIGDARGYNKTSSAILSRDLVGSNEWQRIEVEYSTLLDTKEVEIRARRVSGAAFVAGTAWLKHLTIQRFKPTVYPSAQYLSVNASITKLNGIQGQKQTVYLMVLNKNIKNSITSRITLLDFKPTAARSWTLHGPSIGATNEINPNEVFVSERLYRNVQNEVIMEFPPHSLTAIEIN